MTRKEVRYLVALVIVWATLTLWFIVAGMQR